MNRTEVYRDGLVNMQQYALMGDAVKAAVCGLSAILQGANGIVPVTDDLYTLYRLCEQAVEGFPKLNLETLPVHEMVTIIQGILIERSAFYRQLENLTH